MSDNVQPMDIASTSSNKEDGHGGAWMVPPYTRKTPIGRGSVVVCDARVVAHKLASSRALGFAPAAVVLSSQRITTVTVPEPGLDAEEAALVADVDTLVLAANHISSVAAGAFAPFASLTTLLLSANSMREVPDLVSVPSLTNLDLATNPLGPWVADNPDDAAARFAAVTGLTSLSLRQTGSHDPAPLAVALAPLTCLTSLSLASNPLAEIPALPPPILDSLTSLSLRQTTVARTDTPALTTHFAGLAPNLVLKL